MLSFYLRLTENIKFDQLAYSASYGVAKLSKTYVSYWLARDSYSATVTHHTNIEHSLFNLIIYERNSLFNEIKDSFNEIIFIHQFSANKKLAEESPRMLTDSGINDNCSIVNRHRHHYHRGHWINVKIHVKWKIKAKSHSHMFSMWCAPGGCWLCICGWWHRQVFTYIFACVLSGERKGN